MCAGYGDLELVQFLVDHGADISADDNNALYQSSRIGHFEMFKYLIEIGANIDCAFFDCCENGRLEFAQFCIEKGADINWGNALYASAEYGHFDIVKFLVENTKYINEDGGVALVFSAKNGHLEIVEYLTENCKNISLNDQESALDASVRSGHFDVFKFLAEKGTILQDKKPADIVPLCAFGGNI